MPHLMIRDHPDATAPEWWKNFHRTHGGFRFSDPWPDIEQTISEAGGQLMYFDDNGGISHIEFDDDTMMTFFLLRWS